MTAIEEMEGFFDFGALGGGEAGASEAEVIEASDAVDFGGGGVGGDIFSEAGDALADGEGADADELMEDGAAADEDAIADGDVAGEEGVIGDDDVITEEAIVGDVGACHEEAVVADGGGVAFGGAAVDGTMFAELVMVADVNEAGGGGIEGEILGIGADDRAVADEIMGAEAGVGGDEGVGLDDGMVPDLGMGFDDGEGADGDVGAELGGGVDEGGWVDHERCEVEEVEDGLEEAGFAEGEVGESMIIWGADDDVVEEFDLEEGGDFVEAMGDAPIGVAG